MTVAEGNVERFSGFSDLYDSVRPCPPDELGSLLVGYARTARPDVVDLGSGTGLSSRWASTWAASVVGVEPNDDMRSIAEDRRVPGVVYEKALAQETGLPAASADVMLAVQAMHWMDPEPTLAEVARVLRPGGVLAVVDCDWPPIVGSARAEQAWVDADRRMAEIDWRMAEAERRPNGGADEADGAAGAGPAGPLFGSVDPAVIDAAGDSAGPQDRLGGVRRWGKAGHLARIAASGHFAFTREVCLHQELEGDAARFMELVRSHGTYQQLARRGRSDEELGIDRMQAEVEAAYAAAPGPLPLVFTWRVRLGVTGTT